MFHQRDTLKIDANGHLEIGGCDTVALARAFGTPLYVFDEKQIRAMMRTFRSTFETRYGGRGMALYASKAFCCKAMYAIADREGLGADVVSGGELYTAVSAGFPAEKIYFHGNNKLPREIEEALDAGVGCFVVDSLREAELLDEAAARRGRVQKVLLRINPGVEAHTHAYVQTATPDSKFGFSVANGTAGEMVAAILRLSRLRLAGFHCHIGSQIFEKQSFVLAAHKVMAFAAEMKARFGFVTEELNLGGGFGVWYASGDAEVPAEGYASYLGALIDEVKASCSALGLAEPFLLVEPGRSIVGEAGITLYTVGNLKEIPGLRKYVAVDGGMFENPRYALYQSRYTAVLASRADAPCTERVALAGKCCESGDLLGTEFDLPKVEPGDILAVLTTGAYNYSMASNYNRNPIPPAVLVCDGKAEYIVRPQTYEQIAERDELPPRLG